jgi:putative ABC transport system permease protein
MIGQLPGVTAVQYTGAVPGVNAYRSPYIPAVNTNALTVAAASLDLPAVAGTSVAAGRYLNPATAREPVAVLGAAAAQRMGYDRVWPGMRIWAGGMWFYVAGILNPAALAPQIDSSVLIGFPAAEHYLGFDGHPSSIYVRTQDTPAATSAVDALLGAQADPEDPAGASVSQPSSALTAQADAAGAFDTLFLGLGAVALLVGAVGVASIMVIAALERRQEIGLRRALGATRGQIRIQFLAEAVMLALAGGAAGVALGVLSTAVYARLRGWTIVIPVESWAGGLTAALLIGALAGLLPAIRAARLSPTQALWTLLAACLRRGLQLGRVDVHQAHLGDPPRVPDVQVDQVDDADDHEPGDTRPHVRRRGGQRPDEGEHAYPRRGQPGRNEGGDPEQRDDQVQQRIPAPAGPAP